MDTTRRYGPYILVLSLAIPLISYALGSQNNPFQSPLKVIPSAKQPSEAVDVLVIGGGPAGLSAATTLYRHQLDIRIFDSGKPRNSWDTSIRALPGWHGEKPSQFRAKSRAELEKTGFVDFVNKQVVGVEKKDDGLFYVKTDDGTEWAGRKVLLATGVQSQYLDIPGYLDNYPERILHCLFTFGFEHRGSPSAGVLAVGFAGNPFHANILVDDALKFASKVTVYTNGDAALADAIQAAAPNNSTTYDPRKFKSLTKQPKSVLIEFEDGETKEESFIVHQPGSKVDPLFVEQLGLELNERGDVITKMPFYQTNVAGVFAAGDLASPFKIVAQAVLMGANAAAGIARELPTRITGNSIDRLI